MEDRKTIRREYKESYRPMGVYRFVNTANGKCLVGSSANLPGASNRLRFELKVGTFRNDALQGDWKLYGAEAFEFEVLESLEPPDVPGFNPREDLDVMEELWLEKLSPFVPEGYNKAPRTAG